MTEKELGELSPEDFESLMFDFIEREAATDDMLPDDVFFHLLAEIATRRVVEVIDLEGVIVDDQIVFRQPAGDGPPVVVQGNEILLGRRKIRVMLVPQ